MEKNKIDLKEYLIINQKFLDKQKAIDEKIRKEFNKNPKEYPHNAEELYFFSYNTVDNPEEERIILEMEHNLATLFKEDYEELEALREQVVSLLDKINFESYKEQSSEN